MLYLIIYIVGIFGLMVILPAVRSVFKGIEPDGDDIGGLLIASAIWPSLLVMLIVSGTWYGVFNVTKKILWFIKPLIDKFLPKK